MAINAIKRNAKLFALPILLASTPLRAQLAPQDSLREKPALDLSGRVSAQHNNMYLGAVGFPLWGEPVIQGAVDVSVLNHVPFPGGNISLGLWFNRSLNKKSPHEVDFSLTYSQPVVSTPAGKISVAASYEQWHYPEQLLGSPKHILLAPSADKILKSQLTLEGPVSLDFTARRWLNEGIADGHTLLSVSAAKQLSVGEYGRTLFNAVPSITYTNARDFFGLSGSLGVNTRLQANVERGQFGGYVFANRFFDVSDGKQSLQGRELGSTTQYGVGVSMKWKGLK